ncbi:MAG: hypothetical protein CL862_03640 [Cyanobium sp. NAT70]|jgi:hypothetical protein|nr:hypothetical protein [Cyanobium sp. NAT70]|tara:strand:- start:297 stop:890 length:594 start_codon:yes stop_codon:yes gene_type:complete
MVNADLASEGVSSSSSQGLFHRFSRWLRGDARPSLQVEFSALDQLCPFHLLLNGEGKVLRCGASLQKLLQASPITGQPFTAVLQAWQSPDAEPTALPSSIPAELSDQLLQLMLPDTPELELSGQMVMLQDEPIQRWLLELRPALESLDELSATPLTLQDLSLLDPLRTGMLNRLMEVSLRQELLGVLQEQQRSELLE